MIQAVKDYTDAVENWHPIIYNLYKNIWLACEHDNQDAKSWLTDFLAVKSDIIIKLVEDKMKSFSQEIEKGIKDADNRSETARRIAERLNERIVCYHKIWDTDVEERREYEENYLFLWNENALNTEGSYRNSRLIEIVAKNSGEENAVNIINTLRNLIHRINGKVENVSAVLERYVGESTSQRRDEDATDKEENKTAPAIDWDKMESFSATIDFNIEGLYNFLKSKEQEVIKEISKDFLSKCIYHARLDFLLELSETKNNKLKYTFHILKNKMEDNWIAKVCEYSGLSQSRLSGANLTDKNDFDTKLRQSLKMPQ